MKLSETLAGLLTVLYVIAFLLVLSTFLSWFFVPLEGEWSRWHRILSALDLRREGNVATWAESVLFLVWALSFAVIGWSGPNPTLRLTWPTRWFFRLAAVGACFLSLDEATTFHEMVGMSIERKTNLTDGTALEGFGYMWTLVYTPIVVVGIVLMIYCLRPLITGMPAREAEKRRAWALIAAVCILVLAVLGWEALEACMRLAGAVNTVLQCLEETTELAWIGSAVTLNMLIARSHGL